MNLSAVKSLIVKMIHFAVASMRSLVALEHIERHWLFLGVKFCMLPDSFSLVPKHKLHQGQKTQELKPNCPEYDPVGNRPLTTSEQKQLTGPQGGGRVSTLSRT